jgi:hypothetical protein
MKKSGIFAVTLVAMAFMAMLQTVPALYDPENPTDYDDGLVHIMAEPARTEDPLVEPALAPEEDYLI